METETPFRLALLAILAVNFPISAWFRLRAQRAGGPVSRRGEGWLMMVTWRLCAALAGVIVLLWLVKPSWTAWASWPLPGWVRWSGLGLCAPGFALLAWVFVHLGLNVTDTVAVRRNNTLVQTGPYRWVRHPMYGALALMFGAISLLCAKWPVALLGSVTLALLVRRTTLEEARLIEHHGDHYRAYMRLVGRFFPRIPALARPEPPSHTTL